MQQKRVQRIGLLLVPTVDVRCFAGKPKSDCQRRQAEAQLSSSATPQIMCKPNGSYSDVQCDSSSKECWCVDQNGDEILGTRTLRLLVCSSTGKKPKNSSQINVSR